MNRVRIFACVGASLALAAFGWFLSNTPDALTGVSAPVRSRSLGLALLGIAMVAAWLAFRAAMRAEVKPVSAMIRPQAIEYRRGFGGRVVRVQTQRRQPTQRGVVVALRRAVAEQGREPVSADTGTKLPVAEVERLQEMLRQRAAQLVARNGDMAKGRSMRRGVDLHGLAPR